ncbi:N-acetylglucosamine kinase [Actinokineospora globicatena]|uniref:N-acetylglucosamine kinase n=1 Tax=Actinokineospora globicatena TaxID=103729 RepID=UPI0020A3482A|nr:BadF/BadG/BcrA/BcrD ATPase family protein [Actinokineospora globicatena]MCP2306341.1 BadF-type ATPase [Actinokineospora globicatena]GLW81768.1 N-acetylglucosamine kinase [Actinokineospora globicatena]GLW88563.1 N-acetylglucosamine kinase [Actinokineospora globicatena]
MRTLLAVDGGNSKTDIALVREDGTVVARGRGPGFEPQTVGVAAAVDVVVRTAAQMVGSGPPFADHVAAYLAGADLPEEEVALREEFLRRGVAPSVEVGNDTFALLRAGSTRGWGVAVVCGAGVNAAGIGPDGRVARFPALGRLTGDWGGGQHLGEEVLWHAVRAEDGRGTPTELVSLVRGHFRASSATDVALSVHRGDIPRHHLGELTRPLLTLSDPVALGLVARLAEEICLLGCAILTRLDLLGTPADLILGGGVLTGGATSLMAAVESGYAARAPFARLQVASQPPILGSIHLGLSHLNATPTAHTRATTTLTTTTVA